MEKKKAIEILESLRGKISPMRERGLLPRTLDFLEWKRDVKVAINNIFHSNSSHCGEFDAIAFGRKRISTKPYGLNDKIRDLNAGLEQADALLRSMLSEISLYWSEDGTSENPGGASKRGDASVPSESSNADPKTVFVIHGRNAALRKAMFDFLRAIGLKPLEWSQAVSATGEGSPYVGQVLDKAFSIAQAVVVLMTPDDWAWLKEEFQGEKEQLHETNPTGQARANVIFEAGMSMGRHAKRTVIVEIGSLRPFSDVGGRHVLRMDNSSEKRQDLAERLRVAGCPIDISGRDWHSAGNFQINETPTPKPKDPIRAYAQALQNPERPRLTQEELDIIANANDGWIYVADSSSHGRIISGYSVRFFDPENPSVQAKYIDALDQLAANGLARRESSGHYKLTGRGFEIQKAAKEGKTGSQASP